MVLLAATTLAVVIAIASVRGTDSLDIWTVTTKIYLASSPANILVDFLLPLLYALNWHFCGQWIADNRPGRYLR